MEVRLSEMTLQEVEDFEEKTGMGITGLNEKEMPAKALRAVVWIFGRREDPAFTWEEAGRVEVRSLRFVAEDAQDPPALAGQPPAASAS